MNLEQNNFDLQDNNSVANNQPLSQNLNNTNEEQVINNNNINQEFVPQFNSQSQINMNTNQQINDNEKNFPQQQPLNQISVEQPIQLQNNNINNEITNPNVINSSQSQAGTNFQNNVQQNSNDSNKGLSTASLVLGNIGILAMVWVNSFLSIPLYIIGIICGSIYKKRTNKKCFGLRLNIICLIINIVMIIVSTVLLLGIMNDAKSSAECAEQGGYMQNGECILNY